MAFAREARKATSRSAFDDVKIARARHHQVDFGTSSAIRELRGELKETRGDVQELRGEVQELRGEVREIRGEMKGMREELMRHAMVLTESVRDDVRIVADGLAVVSAKLDALRR